jgi:ATP-dependent RNA helicase DeaD
MPARRKQDPEPVATSEAESSAEVTAPAQPAPENAEPDGSFSALGLIPALLEAVREQGFEEPTPIQRRAVPALLAGRDVVAQAQTGTGKTAAFALPLLQHLDVDDRQVQSLVLTPTRELAVQVAAATHALGRALGVTVLPIYGGQPIERQLRALRNGVQIVIGTPGRVLDHLRRASLSLEHLRTLVLDEADEMLDMGFEEEVEAILAELPARHQTALFSATIPARIQRLAQRYLTDPVRVTIEAERLTVPQVQQVYYEVPERNKLEALTRILDMETPGAGIVFCRTKRTVDDVGEALIARGYPAETLHGDLSQTMRDRVMHRFREGQVELLVATDVAARGLDIDQVSHVINFDIPEDPEQYVHRIGRTARAGRSGDAITLVTPREMRLLHEIERLIRKRIRPARVPTAGDIAARRLELTRESIARAIAEGGLEPYLLAVEQLAGDGDLAQVAAAALRVALERDGSASRTTVNALSREAAQGVETGMQRLFIDLGRKQGVRPGDIVGAITNEAGVPGLDVGAIDIYDNFSFVEVAQAVVERVIDALQSATLHGKSFSVDIARPREEHEEPSRHPTANTARPKQQPSTGQPHREGRPAVSETDTLPADEEEDEDFEPPSRPPNWRDDVRPRVPYSVQPAQRPQRPGGGGRGREGFGPFRGPEPREAPPWQRRRGADRGYGGQHPAEGGSRAPRGGNQVHGGQRPQDQVNRRGGEGRRQRRRDFPPGESGRRPNNFPSGQRPRIPSEGDEE